MEPLQKAARIAWGSNHKEEGNNKMICSSYSGMKQGFEDCRIYSGNG